MRAEPSAQNSRLGVVGGDAGGWFAASYMVGGSTVNRFVTFLLIALVGVPWTAVPAAKAAACAMPRETAAAPPACSYCSPDRVASTSIPSLESGCCRFAPKAERNAAEAGSLGSTPKPSQSPDLAAAIPAHEGLEATVVPAARSNAARGASPPHAPPTRTTHLLL
ncbi:MAG TPA: hypothetical protein VFS09_08370 [Candidatus Eisenbacteria bacterium]|nr:hypothetical protein [Candidatus Eisenbacteria bacterium]